MLTEKGTLPVGVEFEGKVHREYELRPQQVKDSVEAYEDARSRKNDAYFGICVLCMQVVRLGDIPKAEITPALLMEMYDDDLKELQKGKERVEEKLRSFRGQDAADKKTNPRPA